MAAVGKSNRHLFTVPYNKLIELRLVDHLFASKALAAGPRLKLRIQKHFVGQDQGSVCPRILVVVLLRWIAQFHHGRTHALSSKMRGSRKQALGSRPQYT